LNPRAGWFEHRVVLKAEAETPLGNLDLFVTHLTHGDGDINAQQTAALEDFVANHAGDWALIAGDFNARPQSTQINRITQTWIDVYHQAHPEETGFTCCITDRSAPPGELLEKRIDYIFMTSLPEGIIIEQVDVIFDQPIQIDDGWQYASDHAGLYLLLKK
jgi:endonuclease/exonuclease/phosphatase family metal-dependent hydrolase